jgi:Na+/H+ antiporter NhaB
VADLARTFLDKSPHGKKVEILNWVNINPIIIKGKFQLKQL